MGSSHGAKPIVGDGKPITEHRSVGQPLLPPLREDLTAGSEIGTSSEDGLSAAKGFIVGLVVGIALWAVLFLIYFYLR
jgi:hypothetical protein